MLKDSLVCGIQTYNSIGRFGMKIKNKNQNRRPGDINEKENKIVSEIRPRTRNRISKKRNE